MQRIGIGQGIIIAVLLALLIGVGVFGRIGVDLDQRRGDKHGRLDRP